MHSQSVYLPFAVTQHLFGRLPEGSNADKFYVTSVVGIL